MPMIGFDHLAEHLPYEWIEQTLAVHGETSYRELKQSMPGQALTLRSRSPEGVSQEIRGALIAYNLVRLEMSKAATQARLAPRI